MRESCWQLALELVFWRTPWTPAVLLKIGFPFNVEATRFFVSDSQAKSLKSKLRHVHSTTCPRAPGFRRSSVPHASVRGPMPTAEGCQVAQTNSDCCSYKRALHDLICANPRSYGSIASIGECGISTINLRNPCFCCRVPIGIVAECLMRAYQNRPMHG